MSYNPNTGEAYPTTQAFYRMVGIFGYPHQRPPVHEAGSVETPQVVPPTATGAGLTLISGLQRLERAALRRGDYQAAAAALDEALALSSEGYQREAVMAELDRTALDDWWHSFIEPEDDLIAYLEASGEGEAGSGVCPAGSDTAAELQGLYVLVTRKVSLKNETETPSDTHR
jgi:hypothetical protein